MIELSKIYAATNDGLDIILYYYPQAEKSVGKANLPFKIREESAPSAYLKKIGDCWRVTDFGDDQIAHKPIDICIREENVSFREAIQILAQRYNVEGTYIKPEINKAEIRSRTATKAEIEQNFNFKAKDRMTAFELSVFGAKVEQAHCEKLGFQSLEWYSTTKKNEAGNWVTVVIESSEKYPIFLRTSLTDKGKFYKLYQPFALPYKDKKGNFRNNKFAYYNVPAGFQVKNFINGLSQIIEETTENEEVTKLKEIVICSGERDAVNALAYGYFPIWLNSETAELTKEQYFTLKKYAETIYNIPDLDPTGQKAAINLGMKFIDIRTIKLPEKIRQYSDNKGKPRKDLRDYLEIFPEKYELENLFKIAMPYQFWEWFPAKEDSNGKWEVNTEFLLNFLIDSGFRKQRENGKEFFVRISNNVVSEVSVRDIREFMMFFLINNSNNIALRNIVRQSKRTQNSVFEDLPNITIDFSDYTHNSQFFFFENEVVQVKANDILKMKPKETPFIYPEKVVIPLNFKRLAPAFKFDFSKNIFNIENKSSHYFRYLINTSRLHWRFELEDCAENFSEQENQQYFSENHFSISGSRLTDEQRKEQQENLVSKIFTIGYLMHRYKSPSRAWCVWAMEVFSKKTKEVKVAKSAGGTGKSFAFQAIENLGIKKFASIAVQGKDLSNNKFGLSKVTSDTAIAFGDDCPQYLDFKYFYPFITGKVEANEKNQASVILDFKKSPKFVFTSNFPPRDFKDNLSTDRRFQFMIFSDWYHEQGKNGEYRETRKG